MTPLHSAYVLPFGLRLRVLSVFISITDPGWGVGTAHDLCAEVGELRMKVAQQQAQITVLEQAEKQREARMAKLERTVEALLLASTAK